MPGPGLSQAEHLSKADLFIFILHFLKMLLLHNLCDIKI